MQNIQNIALNKLTAWKGNVRRTGADEAIDSLAANIAAHGLLQPLVVQNAGKGKFSVIAGRRRLFALRELAKTGKLADDFLIACNVKDDLSNASELSLSENVMRLPMHPADKFEAFRDLADKGMAPSDIAARFGAPETTVIKLLKLGRVSPEVMRAYREEQIDHAQIQAFAISDDHAAQNQVLEKLLAQSYHMSPQTVRSELVKDEIPATDKRVHFVGLEFYENCGGAVRRDLFDDENSGYVQDVALLNELVNSKLQAAAAELKAENWKWIEIVPDCDWKYKSQFSRIHPRKRELSAEGTEQLEALTQEYEQLQEQGCDEDDEENPKAAEAMRELREQIEALEDSGREWAAEDKAIAGVLVSLDHDGSIEIERGLVKPEDAGQLRPEAEGEFSGVVRKEKVKPEFSVALMRDLTAYRTAALRIELARNPQIALVSVVYALAARVFYGISTGNCVKVSGTPKLLFKDAEEVIPSIKALDDEKNGLDVPEDISELWNWCLERSEGELLKLLAVCAAHSVDAVDANCPFTNGDLAHADHLAVALKLDMRKWFAPTVTNMFGRISRQQILQAYTEVTGKTPTKTLLGLKKGALAVRAEQEIGDKWLPSVLRPPVAEEPKAEAA